MKFKQNLRQAIGLLCSRGPATSDDYTRLVLHCARANDVIQAKRLQSHMETNLFQSTDSFIHNQLLHLYAKCGRLADARNLFDKMTKRDIYSWNALLSAYAKAGSVEDLGKVFGRMPCRDFVSYNTLIACFASNGHSGKALGVLVMMQEDGFQPTQHTYVNALQACSRMLDLGRGKQIHGQVVVADFGKNAFIGNALTDMYAKCGDIGRARWLFDRMVSKNVVSWNLMISGYVKMGNADECIRLFNMMQLSGLKPDHVTISNVLNVYFQHGRVDDARKMFNEMPKKDEICWTTMIVGYTQNGREEDALMLFGDMLRDNVRPDSYTISSVVSSCAKLASLYHGQIVHGKVILMGVDDNMLVSSALVDMYCKCGVTLDAWVIFETMPIRNVITWNAMIRGFAQNGQVQEALVLYERMLQENFRPDNVSFVAVLSACISADMVEEGQKYFNSISEHGMTPTLDHYACMVTLLGRSGHIDKAVDLINGMPHGPDYLIWSTLLSVCAKKGDIKNAELAANHLFELDPHNAGPYIQLSNIYATCGRWKDVADVRSLMKNNNAKKFAAYSWVEVENEVHRFVSEDRTHPEVERIYAKLNNLISLLQQNGYNPDTNMVLHNVGEEEKIRSISYHSEKLALAYALIRKPNGVAPIRIIKNIRVCDDCHMFMKFASLTIGQAIILRDSNRFHHFGGGNCSCKDRCVVIIDRAQWLFDGMVNKNVVSWNLMISGYLKWGMLMIAFVCFIRCSYQCTTLHIEREVTALKASRKLSKAHNLLGNWGWQSLFYLSLKYNSVMTLSGMKIASPATVSVPEFADNIRFLTSTKGLRSSDLLIDFSLFFLSSMMETVAVEEPNRSVRWHVQFASRLLLIMETDCWLSYNVATNFISSDSKSGNSGPVNNSNFYPFAAIPLNNFDGSDMFGEFTSQSDSVPSQPSNSVVSDASHGDMNGKSLRDSKVSPKKDAFQMKSGIWADTLSRGFIDLSISALKLIILTIKWFLHIILFSDKLLIPLSVSNELGLGHLRAIKYSVYLILVCFQSNLVANLFKVRERNPEMFLDLPTRSLLDPLLSEENGLKWQPNKLSESIMQCLNFMYVRLLRTSRAMELEKSGSISRSMHSSSRSFSFDTVSNPKSSLAGSKIHMDLDD
ncbi:hypothetical protein RIF29_34825 [Crotalaria pallida]|uniref:DYW domain-containing protein n=1 Tax=Crotalaria pallida TaxID=3830 RepID=A0AAN9E9J9_CROPI